MILKIIVPHLAAAVSIYLSLALANPTPGGPALFFGIVGILALIIAAVLDIKLLRKNVKSFDLTKGGGEKVRRYMHDLISHAGTVAIFTRDMTWAGGDIQDLLKRKAAQNELTICMQKATDQSRALVAAGATVYYYGENLNIPISTRFTLINLDSQNTELALGKTEAGIHTITRYREADDPSLLLAEDMLQVCRQTFAPAEITP